MTIEVTNFANDIANTGTVSATSLNIIFTDDLFSSATAFNAFSFSNLAITTEGFFVNNSPFDLDNLTIKTGSLFNNQAKIDAASLIVTTGTAFNNSAIINVADFTVATQHFNNVTLSTINTDNFTATVEESFNNNGNSLINADSFTLTANDFNNTSGSTIDAANVTIEVPNFANNISNAGTVTVDSLNFILTADFTHESDSFTGFNNFSNLAITTEGTFTNNAT